MALSTLGNVSEHFHLGETQVFTTPQGEMRITALSSGALRVQVCQAHETCSDFSYAVVERHPVAFERIERTEDFVSLFTPTLEVKVQLHPLRISMYTPDGQLLQEDEKAFGVRWDGDQVVNYKQLRPGEIFLGLGEKTKDLNRAGQQFVNWNTDCFGYGLESDPLYSTIPFYIGIHEDRPYGLFLDNTSKSTFNFGASNTRFSFFQAEKGPLDYYFFYSGDTAGILQQYTQLTGRMELPPLWSLGFQQCRYSYYPDSELLQLARTFRQKRIPADVLYLDIHYMDRYKVFTWDAARFPDPDAMIRELREMGFRVVVIYDPGVKVEPGYGTYDSGMEQDVFLKYPDETPYTGSVWPGPCHFPDFTKPATRKWWAGQMQDNLRSGIAGFWTDMNEPAVWGQVLPDIVEFDYEGQHKTHKEGHNVYGMQMVRSTRQGILEARPEERPFILTRAAYAGAQRYCAIWAGDNTAYDEHMLMGIRMVNSLGLGGMAFAGFDIGGFAGEASPALYARWIAAGAFMPFSRGHSMINSRDAEPWSFGEEVEDISRNYISLRYRLMPYFYTLFREAAASGMPVTRMLPIRYWRDPQVFDPAYQDQFTLGDDILVCPTRSDQAIRKVYLPQGEWFDLFNDRRYAGGQTQYIETPIDKIPVFARAGAIIPLRGLVAHSEETSTEPLELHIYAGEGPAYYDWYEDDGLSFAYREGAFFARTIEVDMQERKLHLHEASARGIDSAYSRLRIYLHGFGASRHPEAQALTYRFVDPVSNFDPFVSTVDESKTLFDLPCIEIGWSAAAETISF